MATIIFSLLFLAKYLFRVSQVVVNLPEKNQTLLGLEQVRNHNLLFISEDDLAEKLKAVNPGVKEITVIKKWPNQIMIYVQPADTLAQLKVGGGFFWLDEQGRIIFKTKTEKADLPQINYYQKLDYYGFSSGDYITYNDLKAGLKLIKKAENLGLNVITVDIRGSYMIALKLKQFEVLVTTEKDLDSQIDQFGTVYKLLKIRGQGYKRLDLRFDKPVIETKDSS